jgi:hypothetical protein
MERSELTKVVACFGAVIQPSPAETERNCVTGKDMGWSANRAPPEYKSDALPLFVTRWLEMKGLVSICSTNSTAQIIFFST